jgi:peptidoglycan/LPS O-acetylase OafA/YrhL
VSESKQRPVHIPALDGVRGIAIVLVMLSHFLLVDWWTNLHLYTFIQGGWMGVDLFFVLSGFLITGILLDTKGRPNYWSGFYRRRLLRIFPLYYTVVIITWFATYFIENQRPAGYDSFGWFFGFAPNIAIGLKNDWSWHSHIFNLNHLWSLAVEEQFYIFWPLMVYLLPRRYLLGLCVLLVYFSTGLRHLTDEWMQMSMSRASYVLPYCRMDGLAAGSFLAIFLRLELNTFVPYDKWLARFLLVWMGYRIADALWFGNTQFLATMTALFFASFLYLALNTDPGAWVRRLCENRFLRHLGKFSYGLYIFHQMFEYFWHDLFRDPMLKMGLNPVLAQSLYILLAFGGTYVLARISWVVIEQPFLRLKSRV